MPPKKNVGPTISLSSRMASPLLSFIPAVRVVLDLQQLEPDMRIDVSSVKLVLFGESGERYLKTRRGSLTYKTSYFVPLGDTVLQELKPDPRHLDVFYLCCSEEAMKRSKSSTEREPVLSYISQVLRDEERCIKAPDKPKFKNFAFLQEEREVVDVVTKGKQREEETNAKKKAEGMKGKIAAKTGQRTKHMIYGLCKEDYFMHKVRNLYMRHFLEILSDEEEVVNENKCFKFEPKTTPATTPACLFVSWHTVVRPASVL